MNKFENPFTTNSSTLEKTQFSGLGDIFEQFPRLAEIGTTEQYDEYLKTIFPNSKVQEIVYHGSLVNITGNFKSNQHFGSLEAAKSRNHFKKQVIADMVRQEYYYPALLNIETMKRTDDADYAWDNEIEQAKKGGYTGLVYMNNNEGKNSDSYLVFEPEQIHLLGSEDDMQKFKEFISK